MISKVVLILIVDIVALSASFKISNKMEIQSVDETNLTDSTYLIKSANNELYIGAMTNVVDPQYRLALVSSESKFPGLEESKILWKVFRATFQSDDDPFVYREIQTLGPNHFNVMDLENPLSYPVSHFWRLLNWQNGVVGLNSILQFDWDNVGQNKCLQNNGLKKNVSFVECDQNDERQHWTFVDVTLN